MCTEEKWKFSFFVSHSTKHCNSTISVYINQKTEHLEELANKAQTLKSMDKEHKQDKRATKPDCAWAWSTGKGGINHCSCPKIVKKRGVDLTYPEALSNRLTGGFPMVFPTKAFHHLRSMLNGVDSYCLWHL